MYDTCLGGERRMTSCVWDSRGGDDEGDDDDVDVDVVDVNHEMASNA